MAVKGKSVAAPGGAGVPAGKAAVPVVPSGWRVLGWRALGWRALPKRPAHFEAAT